MLVALEKDFDFYADGWPLPADTLSSDTFIFVRNPKNAVDIKNNKDYTSAWEQYDEAHRTVLNLKGAIRTHLCCLKQGKQCPLLPHQN